MSTWPASACGASAGAAQRADANCRRYTPNAAGTSPNVHSPLIGIALDGRGIYGAWEGNGAPVLDSCNGHVGAVPGTFSLSSGATNGYTTSPSGMPTVSTTNTYHYHVSNTFPFTVGCFASSTTSYSACAAVYPGAAGSQGGCGTFIPAVLKNTSTYFYDSACRLCSSLLSFR